MSKNDSNLISKVLRLVTGLDFQTLSWPAPPSGLTFECSLTPRLKKIPAQRGMPTKTSPAGGNGGIISKM
eukprot:14651052-Alexandrium_andersonii.AAC.1